MSAAKVMIYQAPDKSPVELVSKDQMIFAMKRMRAIVPGGSKMSDESIMIIAQEAILYRIVPGRDMHYYEDWDGSLVRSPDYKYLKNFANFKEQMLSGDDTATLEDSYRVLNADEKERHGAPEHCIVAECTIVTSRERRKFADEVRTWRDLGFEPAEAVAMARETIGKLGTSAVGITDPTAKTKKGNLITPPAGWTFLQWAEKLAFKNAVHRKYGIPTADEMAAMAHHMARRASGQDWRIDNIDQPVDVQARLADLEHIAAEVQAEQLTADERRVRLAKNVTLTRDYDGGIGDDDPQDWSRFVATVLQSVPWYGSEQDVSRALVAVDMSYSASNEEMLFDELTRYANRQADKAAA